MKVKRITEVEQELLGLFSEEGGEAQQIVGKILRHGLDSWNPVGDDKRTNKELLEYEVGHVLAAIELLMECRGLDREALYASKLAKLKKLRSWLHNETILDAVERVIFLEEMLKASREEQASLRERVGSPEPPPPPPNAKVRKP